MQTPQWEGKYLFRTINSTKKQVSQGQYDGDMTLPSMQEFFILFDRFAQGGDLANQIGASYPKCRGAFENAFLGTYYSLRWYQDQIDIGFDPSIMSQVQTITAMVSYASDFIVQCSTSIEAGQTTL